jgi:hypothetical protein
VSTSNWSTCQSVKLTNCQLTERLIWSLSKTTRTNLIIFQTIREKKKVFKPWRIIEYLTLFVIVLKKKRHKMKGKIYFTSFNYPSICILISNV